MNSGAFGVELAGRANRRARARELVGASNSRPTTGLRTRSTLPNDLAIEHHEPNASAEHADVVGRIALDDQEVGELADFDRTELIA